MKKIILITSLLILTPGVTAAFECNYTHEASCTAAAGCIYTGGSCRTCDTGQYSAAGSNKCYQCTGPAEADFTGPGDGLEKCPWTLTCPQNTHFDGRFLCNPCDSNRESAATTVTYDGNTWPAATQCTGKIYTITLKSNFLKTEDFKYVYVQYGTGFGLSKTGPFIEAAWHDPNRPQRIITQPTNNYCGTFLGYFLNEKQYVQANGILMPDIISTSFTGDTELTAKWDAKTYTIKYTCPNSGVTPPTTNCKFGTNCTVAAANACGNGKIVTGWTCTENCGNIQEGNKPGKEISFSACPITDSATTTYTITLQAVERDCTAGYYCDSTGEQKCPYGSTSISGASNITDCYYDNNITFTDNTGASFKLPAGTKINYSGN